MSNIHGEEFKALLEHLAPFRIMWNGAGELLDVSPKALAFLDIEMSEVSGGAVYLHHPYEIELTAPIIRELTNMTLHVSLSEDGERYLRGEVIHLGKGQEGWMFSGVPPISATESMTEMGVNLRDLPLHMGITDFILANEAANVALNESRRANENLQKTSEQLRSRSELLEQKSAALVEQIRKHQFVSARLEEALQELEITQDALVRQERYKALGEMISGIAHDFNNMLTPILSYSAILKEEPDIPAEEREQFLDWIMTAACDASELIKRLRRLYKPDMDSGTFKYFDVGRVVDDALALALPRWSSKSKGLVQKIDIERHYEGGLTVFGAESDVRQAILNLLVNAGDAMPEGGTLTLTTKGSEQDVCISVMDTGIGMDAKTFGDCRSVFFSTKGERGSGLGLPMVSNTAVRHGGRVEAESSLGRGTVFHFYLSRDSNAVQLQSEEGPRDLSGTNALWAESGEPSTGSELGTQRRLLKSDQIEFFITALEARFGRQIKMVLVDDDPGASSAIHHLAEKLGVQCASVQEAQTGLSSLEGDLADVVIADVDMPGMRGDEFAIEARGKYPGMALLLYTGRPESVSGEGREAADHILPKPLEAREVLLAAMITLAEKHGIEAPIG